MYVDFARLYALLKEDAILSYKLMSRLFCEPSLRGPGCGRGSGR